MHLKYHNLFMFCWQQRSACVKLMVNVLDFFYIRCYSVVFFYLTSLKTCAIGFLSSYMSVCSVFLS